ncbi:MAG: abortive infection family protein [Verrucomicrobia bacterium]|nr:abortive infection family protein [Verrucomicrobiota bacterium]
MANKAFEVTVFSRGDKLNINADVGQRTEMNLRLNARQKGEIAKLIKKARLDPNDFAFTTRKSECVFVFVQHAYRALDGDEPTTAEVISLRANPEYFFTFERNENGVFYATAFPELEVARSIKARDWQGLLNGFEEWLQVLRAQIEADGTGPAKSRTFVDLIHERDYAQIRNEFSRAEQNCTSDPPAAIAAASSMVESACKLYIADHGLALPSNQTIKPLWSTVAKDLLPDPPSIADDDTRKLISGLASVVDGLGSLRTQVGSVHGRGRSEPQVGHAEALVAIHGSQALVLYMIQKWNKQ